MKVLILGAGGPVAQAAIKAIEDTHELRLADLNPLESDRHECVQMDVTDAGQVLNAARGVDAILNSTVIRHDRIQSWRVNFIGCYNALKAAAELGIKRFIQTSPTGMFMGVPDGYNYDWPVDECSPPRPGTGIYSMTKYLANETCKVFADRYDIQVIAFGYMGFSEVTSYKPASIPCRAHPEDAGQAFRLALEVDSLPRKYEFFQITAEWAHEQYGMEKARRLLGYVPKYNYNHLIKKV
ncbi:MAG: NAD(P)-dependent oxidoreductase [Planctomycetota bacterium]|nr:NAD(P)-dependent oxidoreductase [Planctomycetota bacterium]MDA1141071.1 NAD(P)-dependent oxidoreductase [Planctomycetota bacterium]